MIGKLVALGLINISIYASWHSDFYWIILKKNRGIDWYRAQWWANFNHWEWKRRAGDCWQHKSNPTWKGNWDTAGSLEIITEMQKLKTAKKFLEFRMII